MNPQVRPAWLDKPSTVGVIKRLASFNVRLYQLTGGRLGGTWRIGTAAKKPVPICLLTHTGRKTGKPRTTPLVFLQDGGQFVVVASQGGLPKNPQWFYNLKANPEATLQVRNKKLQVRARVADAQERDQLWPRLVDLYADYATYQEWTERTIPVVVLEPS